MKLIVRTTLYLPLPHIISSKAILNEFFISFSIKGWNICQQLYYWQVPPEEIVLGSGGQRLQVLIRADAGQEARPVTHGDQSQTKYFQITEG